MKKHAWSEIDLTLPLEIILDTYKISYNALYKHCKKNGIAIPKRTKKPKEHEQRPRKPYVRTKPRKVPSAADLSDSLTTLANKYGVDNSTILRERKRLGITGDPSKSRQGKILILPAEARELVQTFAEQRGLSVRDAALMLIKAGLVAQFKQRSAHEEA
jgi:hypothetical protein